MKADHLFEQENALSRYFCMKCITNAWPEATQAG